MHAVTNVNNSTVVKVSQNLITLVLCSQENHLNIQNYGAFFNQFAISLYFLSCDHVIS